MATIKEVAREAGVSVGTVSNVLSGTVPVSADLRARVESAIRRLDYHPDFVARSLKARQTKTLGMVISDITNPFFPQMVRGAEDAALPRGYFLITLNTDDQAERETQVLSLLRSRRVDGILLVVAPPHGRVEQIRKAVDAGVPVVFADRVPPQLAVDHVAVNNVKGAQVCIRHLIKQGHRRIAIVTGLLGLQTARDRLEGYKAALSEAGIEPSADLILEGDYREQSGYLLGKELMLRHTRPTAIFISNAMMTLGVVRAVEETGFRCPEDVAIATFDDLREFEVFQPHLTAVAQPSYQLGWRAAEILMDRIEGRIKSKKNVSIILEPELKVRESTSLRVGQAISAQSGE